MHTNKKSGFIKTIILIVAALIVLQFVYDINVIDTLTVGKYKEVGDFIIKSYNYLLNLAKSFSNK